MAYNVCIGGGGNGITSVGLWHMYTECRPTNGIWQGKSSAQQKTKHKKPLIQQNWVFEYWIEHLIKPDWHVNFSRAYYHWISNNIEIFLVFHSNKKFKLKRQQ